MHTTTDRAALLAAILADPDDDGARLAYADLLEEEGERERAEFIRIGIVLAGLIEPEKGMCGCPWNSCDHCRYRREFARKKNALRRRERELLGDDFCRWGVRIPRFTSFYRRGFVAAVTCTAADFLHHADAIFASQPITEVRLTTWPEVEVSFGPFPPRPERGETCSMCIANLRGLNRPLAVPYDDRPAARLLLKHAFPRVHPWHLPGDTPT